MKYTMKNLNTTPHEAITRRQAENLEKFMQERAGVFQVAEIKDQAMFWAMH